MERVFEFAGNHPLLVSGAFILSGLVLFNELRLLSRRGVDLGPQAAIGLINRGAAVLDLRSIERYHSGHIIGARHIPQDDLGEAAANKLKGLKGNAVIVYDDNGVAAARAATLLRSLDFPNAVNLRGGITAWERDNLPLEKGRKKK